MKTSARFCNTGTRRGIALFLVLGVLMVLFLGGLVLMRLSSGVQNQLNYADHAVRAQYIGESCHNFLMARLLSRPWEKRWFGGGQ